MSSEGGSWLGGAFGLLRGARDLGASAIGYATDGATAIGRAVRGTAGSVRAMAANAPAIVKSLKSAHEDAGDRERLVNRFLEALPAIVPQVDRHADAISIGYLGEAGIGFLDAQGTELLYVRPKNGEPARLRVAEVEGLVARVNVGVVTKAFFRCIYGEPGDILKARKRLGTEVGASFASVQFFRAVQPREDRPELTREELDNYEAPTLARGWTTTIGGGIGLGLPLVSDASAFRLEEKLADALELTPEQHARIELLLASAPDRSTLRDFAIG